MSTEEVLRIHGLVQTWALKAAGLLRLEEISGHK